MNGQAESQLNNGAPAPLDTTTADGPLERWEIAALMIQGPLSATQISDGLRAWGPRFTTFVPDSERHNRRDQVRAAWHLGPSSAWLATGVPAALTSMTEAGWVTANGATYALTEIGHAQANRAVAAARGGHSRVMSLVTEDTAARVTLLVQGVLAVLKLPAALLSGSVAQLNDAADTLLDLISSAVVYVGLRLGRERAASIVLVVLMLGTSAFALVEAIGHFFGGASPELTPFPVVVAVGSIAVYGILWAYQRFVGLRAGSLALIAQSVDSRNHILVALGVVAGLLTAPLGITLIDSIVGLVVALLILRSALELVVELARTRAGGEPDLSRFGFGLGDWFERRRRERFRDWMLYLVANEGLSDPVALVARAEAALIAQDNPLTRELAPARIMPTATASQTLAELRELRWVEGDSRLAVTGAGLRRLRRWRHTDRQ